MRFEDLRSAIVQGDRERFDDLIDEVDQTGPTESGKSLLYLAGRGSHHEMARELLDRGVDPNVRNVDGRTPLFGAAREGATECVRLLLEAGAAVDAEDGHGNTPLQKAAYEGHPEVIRLLLEAGANPNHENKHGNPVVSDFDVPGSWPDDLGELLERRRASMDTHRSDPKVVGFEAGHERVPVEEFDDPGNLREWLWDELVPPSGQADTVQGELHRIVEGLQSEANRNGNINWSEGFEMWLDFLEEHLCDGDTFDAATVEQTRSDVKALRRGAINDQFNDDIYARLNEQVVDFCRQYPELIEKPHDDDLPR